MLIVAEGLIERNVQSGHSRADVNTQSQFEREYDCSEIMAVSLCAPSIGLQAAMLLGITPSGEMMMHQEKVEYS